MQLVTSPQNPRFKAACRLHTSRGRKQQGRIILHGQRESQRALEAGLDIREAFLCPELMAPPEIDKWQSDFDRAGAVAVSVPVELFSKLAYGDRQDGVVAVARRPSTELSQLRVSDQPFVVVVEAVEKPGNLGAVLRTADAAAVDAVIVADGHTDVFHPNAIRASLGCVFTVPLAVDHSPNVFQWLVQRGVRIYAARTDAQQWYTDVDWNGPAAVVLGSEARGLSDHWRAPDVQSIGIPMLGRVDSLNLSVSTAVICFEARRQRGFNPQT